MGLPNASPLLLQGLLLALTLLAPALGGYLITTPRRWVANAPSQVCVTVKNATAPAGHLNITLSKEDRQYTVFTGNSSDSSLSPLTIIASKVVEVPAGTSHQCHEVQVSATDERRAYLHLDGPVGGSTVKKTQQLNLKSGNLKSFLQTDKYVYKPGQLVQLRILTVEGPDLQVSTEAYPEVWITNPSRTRIAQWKNVDNTVGLVHLDYRLPEEPEEGIYVIRGRRTDGSNIRANFKVEEFVLPRFEVKIKAPPFILATDDAFTFSVCANYTFGQPVKGNLSLSIHNGERKKCRVEITKNITISGCADVDLTAVDFHIVDCDVYNLQARATVTEEGTGVALGDSASTSIERSAVSFKTIYKDVYMKPNLPYTLKVRAERPDGSVAAGVPMEVCAAGRCTNTTTAADGIFTTLLPNYDSYGVKIKALNCRATMHSSEFSQELTHYFSPSNSSLVMHAPEDDIKCVSSQSTSHVLPVLFSARDQPSAHITVQVISRGRIQFSSSQEYQLVEAPLPINAEHLVEPLPPPIPGTVRGVINVNLDIPPTASPTARVLVWYTRDNGEVVSDSRELKVEKCLTNNVSLSWSTKKAQPGDSASITLTSEPDSVCSLGVVDKSSELLNNNPDPINLNALFTFADGFKVYPWERSQVSDYRYCQDKHRPILLPGESPIPIRHYNYYTDYVDALKMFDDAGVFVISDYTLETRPCEKDDFGGGFGGGGPFLQNEIAFAAPAPQAAPGIAISADSFGSTTDREGAGGGATPEAPRTDFPETWLWDLVVVPASGVSEQPVTVPDTITQWNGKAVCVHPKKGVGLSNKEPLITFTPFFVDLTLPPTVKRGEVLPVKMSVFNYLDQPIPVSLTLGDSTEYEILEEPGSVLQRGKRSACIPAQDKSVLTIKIKPTEIADVNISVSALVDQASMPDCGAGFTAPQRSDALIKPIKVEAEGFLRENTWTKYICAEDLASGEDSLENWDLVLPTTLVEGSARGWVTVVGDLLALSLENLGHLIRMPYGCGEQNMLNFAPNIYILRYLDATNQTTPEARTKLINFMTTGYRRELLYRRNNGSYSAFGNADDSGSTWLTAFVLKSFAQASKDITIDEGQQNQTSSWLAQQQEKDGCFKSVGKLLHKDMQGGVSTSKTPAPLTAYVMAALVEAGRDPAGPAVSKAAECLLADTSIHPYTLALKAYALALAGHPQAAAAVQTLMDNAVVSMNATYWELPNANYKSRAAALETAAYGVLAMMTHDPVGMKLQARKVIKWMTVQRNGQGGFYSTQDTVVALQAMAAFESHLGQGPLNVQATLTGANHSHSFTVTKDNKLLQQYEPLPYMPTLLNLTIGGEGCAVVQAVQRYNIPEAEPSDAFDLTVNTITVPDTACVTKRITVCASYILPDAKSNMAVIEVDLISGYIPKKADLKQLLKDDHNIKRYEVDGSLVTFYIDELTATDTCVNFDVIREVDMEEVKPGTVVVYDYYQPDFKISKRYTLPANTECR